LKKCDLLQLVKFGTVGFFNTLLDYGSFYVFFALLNINKNPAQILATVISMTNSYFVNRYWTFERRGKIRRREVIRFVVVNVLSLSVTLLCLNLFHDVFQLHKWANEILAYWNYSFELSGDFEVMFCKMAALPFSWGVNFFGNRFWVFGKKTERNVT